jgi:hypothetical protein
MDTSNIGWIVAKSFLIGGVNAVLNLWWLWLLIGITIFVRYYLINSLDIQSYSDLFNYLLSKANPKLNKYQLPEEIVFPKGFVWASDTVFKFGEYGAIDFQTGANIGKHIFKCFTEAKGKYVPVRVISKELDTSDKDIRARIKTLNDRLSNVKGIKKGFVKIKPSGKGSYRLYISPLLNNPKD